MLGSGDSGAYAGISEGIRYAADNEADIINMSLGGDSASSTLEEALEYAYDKGVTIICASGNDGSSDTIKLRTISLHK